MTNFVLKINEKPKKWYQWILYPLQIVLAVFVATVLIANICGTPVSSCLLGAAVGTLVYQIITKFKSPMFISSCGATVSAVCGALALNETGSNYLMVFCGGLIILAIYAIFALIVKVTGIETINKIFPPIIVGSVTMVIGLNLATFIYSYCAPVGENSTIPVLLGIITMVIVAVASHYGKGFLKQIPFLVGLAGGYVIALIITLTTPIKLIDFSSFSSMQWYPDLVFLKWSAADWSFANLGRTVLYFVPVGVCALLEHYSDHKVLSNIVGQDLTVNPGLSRTLVGDGAASALGTIICGLPNTSYGESIATMGFSRVVSVYVATVAAAFMGFLSFIGPVQAAVVSIPSCIFGGCAMILYGYIALSGLQTLCNANLDFTNNKTMIVISVILTVGVSGIFLFDAAFSGVSLAMVLGVLLNLVLIKKKNK